MIRRQIYLTSQEISELNGFSKELGISTSEYIRRIIDDHVLRRKGGAFKNNPKFLKLNGKK